MKENLRKVKTTKFSDGSGGFTENGYFHQWGIKAHLMDNGQDFGVTTGVIEREDGRIEMINPKNINSTLSNLAL